MTVDVSCVADTGVSGRWLASLDDVTADGTVESSLSRSSDDVDVDNNSGDVISRCDVVKAETFALTVERSPEGEKIGGFRVRVLAELWFDKSVSGLSCNARKTQEYLNFVKGEQMHPTGNHLGKLNSQQIEVLKEKTLHILISLKIKGTIELENETSWLSKSIEFEAGISG